MLTITYLPDNTIKLQSEAIQEMIDNIEDYSKVKIEATINCCPEVFMDEEDLDGTLDTTKFVITSDSIIVKPPFFGLLSNEDLKDGVYHFKIKLYKPNDTFVFEEMCAFIDVTYKCKVSAFLKDLLDKSEDGVCATNVHVLHYALVNGSNCGCNCTDMCDVFKELTKLIKPINLQPQGCGC